jgi:exonuclease VII small subunit
MVDAAGIRITIVTTADTKGVDQAKAKVIDLGKAADKAGKDGAKGLNELAKPAATLKQAFSQLTGSLGIGGGVGGQVFGVLKGAVQGVKAETAGLNSLWNVSGTTLATLGAVGVAAGIGLVVVAKKAADAFANWAMEVKSVQARTGASAEESSRFAVIMEHLGIDADTAARSFQILGRNVVQGAPAFTAFFTAAQLARLRTGDLISSLPILQQKFQSLGTAQEKSAFVMAAFGRGGAALRPLLSLTAAEMANLSKESDRLGLTLTQEGIAKATAYKRSLNDLGLAARGLQVNVGKDLVSGLTSFSNALVTASVKIHQLTSSSGWQWLFGSNTKPDVLVRALYSISGGHVDLRRKVDDTAASLQAEQDDADATAQSLDTLQSATLGLFNANRSYERAVHAVSSAQESLSDAQRSLSKLQAQGAVDAKAVAAAHKEIEQAARGVTQAERGIYDADRGLIEAHRGVETAERSLMAAQEQRGDAVRSLASAQRSLADAQQRFQDVQAGAAPLDIASAQLRAQQATTGVLRAQQRLSQAEANAVKVGGDYNATAADKEDANLSVTEASQGLQAAQIDQQRAQEDLTKVMAEGTAGSETYKQALDDVQSATQAVEQAQRAQRDSSQAVTDAQVALIDSAGRVEQAEYGHGQALLALRDAQDAVLESRAKLREAEAGDPDFADRLASARRGVASAERSLSDARLDAGAAALARVQAEEKEADALTAAGGSAKVLVDRLNQIKGQFPQYAAFFDQLLKLLGSTLLSSNAAFAGFAGSPFAGPAVPGRVPGFQHGGTVPGPVGAPMLAVVHGGERITQAGATSTVNIYVGGSIIAERDLADTVRRALIDQARRGG